VSGPPLIVDLDNWTHAGDVAEQLVADLKNKAQDKADTEEGE